MTWIVGLLGFFGAWVIGAFTARAAERSGDIAKAQVWVCALILFFIVVFPHRVISFGALSNRHHGIAPSGVVLTTFFFAIILGMAFTVTRRSFFLPASWIVFTGVELSVMILGGTGANAEISGIVSLVTGFVAFGVGRGLQQGQLAHNEAANLSFVRMMSLIIFLQVAVVIASSIGLQVPEWLGEGISSGRASGTSGNSGNFGKVMFLLVALLLPFCVSKCKKTRQLSYFGVICGAILCGMSAGRANMLAVGILLLVWFLFGPARSILLRMISLGVLAIGVIGFSNVFIVRMLADPQGSLRPALLEAGIIQIASAPWTGVGLNEYVEVVGRWDEATATGFPVHNSFLLMTAEVGIPMAIAFYLPVIVLAARAIAKVCRKGKIRQKGWGIIGVTLGILVLGVSGWGMLQLSMVPLWMFVLGWLSTWMQKNTN
jgi:hypothetical protein